MRLDPFGWDERIFSIVNSIGRSSFDYICAWPTHFGNPLIFSFLALVFMLIWDEKTLGKKFAVILTSTLLANLAAQFLKGLIFRPRPYIYYQEMIQTGAFKINALFGILARESSFPSGHTTTIFAGITALVLIYGGRLFPLYLLGVFVGFTRLYVGVHFPSDILAAIILGVATGYGVFIIFYRTRFIIPARK